MTDRYPPDPRDEVERLTAENEALRARKARLAEIVKS